MNKQTLHNIIRKYLNKELPAAKKDTLIQWFSDQPYADTEDMYNELGDQIDELSDADLQKLRLMLKAERPANKRLSRLAILQSPALKIAASIFIVFALSLTVYVWQSGQPVEYVTKTTGKTTTKVTLPDGSEVWLNASSTLKYPKTFDHKRRDIYLEGEAFFKVVHDKTSPFIVMTHAGLYTQVLGTSFNINAYPNSKELSVAVVSGMVAVGKGKEVYSKLVRGEQLVFNPQQASYVVEQAAHAEAWTNGTLVFNNKSLIAIAAVLEHTYTIKIVVDQNIPAGLNCTGTFSTDQKPAEIIRTLCLLYDLKFDTAGNTIKIRKGNK